MNEIDGVIRAPKVKLEGIKVVGKIDLPEPKIKEPENKEDEDKVETNNSTEPCYR